jgi:hypothetical protein
MISSRLQWLEIADAGFFPRPQGQQTNDNAADAVVVEEAPEAIASFASDDFSFPAPQLGSLLFGALSGNLPVLKRAVDDFLDRAGSLAAGFAAWTTPRFLSWLVAAALAGGAAEFARRRARPPNMSEAGDHERNDPTWAPFPVLAVLPSED